MKKIIAFAGSNSRQSINKKLATFTSNQMEGVSIELLDLNDFQMSLYGIDEEQENGIPQKAHELLNAIHGADGIILSLAEHNGAYTVAFKNVLDWMSRINSKIWNNIPMLLMATSPGGRGGSGVLALAKASFAHMGGNVIAGFSLPAFGQHFSEEGITDAYLKEKLDTAIGLFSETVVS